MSESSAAAHAPIDVELGGAFLANMLAGWLDGDRRVRSLWRQPMNTAITEQHLSKTAYVYVRQSTLAQVRHHQESTERQYALKRRPWNWAGTIRRFRFWTGIWASREHR
jgi:hypothetical protein